MPSPKDWDKLSRRVNLRRRRGQGFSVLRGNVLAMSVRRRASRANNEMLRFIEVVKARDPDMARAIVGLSLRKGILTVQLADSTAPYLFDRWLRTTGTPGLLTEANISAHKIRTSLQCPSQPSEQSGSKETDGNGPMSVYLDGKPESSGSESPDS